MGGTAMPYQCAVCGECGQFGECDCIELADELGGEPYSELTEEECERLDAAFAAAEAALDLI